MGRCVAVRCGAVQTRGGYGTNEWMDECMAAGTLAAADPLRAWMFDPIHHTHTRARTHTHSHTTHTLSHTHTHNTHTQVYGRGTVDMLSTVAVHAVVYARIASAKLPLKGTLVFCAVADEEAGGKDGVGYVRGCVRVREWGK